MTRKSSAIEVNNFVGGLITEASPLTFPPNASVDESNFVLNRNGSRQRRLGMDFETNYNDIVTTTTALQGVDLAVTSFRWVDVSGDNNLQLAVVQTGDVLTFFNINRQPLSSEPIFTYEIGGLETNVQVSYANADGVLVVATGQGKVLIFSYEEGVITPRFGELLIRDLFGVEVHYNGLNLRDGNNVAVRPLTLPYGHLYNLRNQTWALPARPGAEEYKEDNVWTFWYTDDYNRYPSNADLATASMYPLPDDTHDRVGDRFFAPAAQFDEPVSTDAPRGYFIIDALNRGQSRLVEYQKYQDRFATEGLFGRAAIRYGSGGLPVDRTLGGPSVVASFSGRVCYAGFNGDLVGGDDHSPRMSSYILISRLIEDPTDLNKCYQRGDPTASDNNELLDDDGLFLRISGAKKIKRMINIDSSLLVFAENGVWALEGGSEYGFSSTNFKVSKVSNSGCEGPYSIVYLDDSVIYWAKDGIYVVGRGEGGLITAENITENSIQTFYNDIGSQEREYCQGIYQAVDRKVRWLYNARPGSTGSPKELIFDVTLKAFYPWEIKTIASGYPKPMCMVDSPEYAAEDYDDNVVYNGVLVEYNTDQVAVGGTIASSRDRKLFYITAKSIDPVITYSFSSYKDETFSDWKSVDGFGVDSGAFAITGWMPDDEFQRNKQAVYTTFHFNRTENSVIDVDGELVLGNPSSCIVQAQWDWSNSYVSNRWGPEFQAYRYGRLFTVDSAQDTYDTGFETIQTKNKMRGKGKVLSIKIKTEPGKDCQLLGWSMILSGAQNV